MESAARLPLATASIRLRGPKATSPPANNPPADVASVSGLTLIVPCGVSSTWSSGLRNERSACCPMARITESTSKISLIWIVNRTEASIVVVSARDANEFDGFELSVRADEFLCAPLRNEMDALSLRLFKLFAALSGPHHRHLGKRFETGDVNFDCARANRSTRRIDRRVQAFICFTRQVFSRSFCRFRSRPQSHARRIESNEPAADDQHLLAQLNAIAVVDVQQVIDCLDHAIEVGALDVHVPAFLHAYAEED